MNTDLQPVDADNLARLVDADQLLALAETAPDYLDVMNAAEVARVMAQRAKLGTSAANRATRIKLLAEAGLADAIDRGQEEGTIQSRGNQPKGSGCESLTEIGTNSRQVREARLVATALNSVDLDTITEERDRDDRDLTRSEIVAIGRRIESGILPGEADDWYTPEWLFDVLNTRFDLDVCAPMKPEFRTCPADRYLTEADDGLTTDWDGLVWCNPPYSDAGPWARKWIEHGNGVILTHIPANAAWMVELDRAAEAKVMFQAMEFTRPTGDTYRPGYALQLAGIGEAGIAAVLRASETNRKTGRTWERAA